jgi:hypothetical protein
MNIIKVLNNYNAELGIRPIDAYRYYKLQYNGKIVHQSNSLDVINKYNRDYCYGKGLVFSCYV